VGLAGLLACDGAYGGAGAAGDGGAARPAGAPTRGAADAIARAASPEGLGGLFSASPTIQTFRPCGVDESWWPEGLDLYGRYKAAGAQDLDQVYARVRGEVSERGAYGHFNAYEREIRVTALLELRARRDDDCR
jgi:hypothetical protein